MVARLPPEANEQTDEYETEEEAEWQLLCTRPLDAAEPPAPASAGARWLPRRSALALGLLGLVAAAALAAVPRHSLALAAATRAIFKAEVHNGDIVMIDAGSTGCKVFAFFPQKASAKLMTHCRTDLRQAGHPNQGLATLVYNQSECQWLIGPQGKPEVPLLKEDDYVEHLLGLLASTYKAASQKPDVADVRNKGAVPILATAGMRLLPQAENARVWSHVCGKTAAGLTIAPAGERCGTIPGTTEAYYDFLANAAHGTGERVLTGTFTVGGASAQISVPLQTAADVEAFRRMRANIAAEMDCSQLKTAEGTPAPIFNTKREGGPRSECLDDYVAFRPASEVRATPAVANNNIRVASIQGIGLISFLGLQGGGTLVAGGVEQIQAWAKSKGCSGGRATYASCRDKLRTALSQDVLWKHVTTLFHERAWSMERFSYNSYAALPEAAGVPHVDGEDQGWELMDELNHTCGANMSATFGFGHANTCMKALFTSLFITSFFEDPNRQHSATYNFHADPKRDWTEGKLEDEKAAIPESRRLRREAARLPLRRAVSNYMHGAWIHFSAD